MRYSKIFLILILVSFFSFANGHLVFESVCGKVNYKIMSYCKKNDLKPDQDKLDIPICDKQTITLGNSEIDLTKSTGFAKRTNSDGKTINMMDYVFYGASCKGDRIILSASGGCNSCGEKFVSYNLKGQEIKEKKVL